jgi:hypothetical protein
MPYEYTDKDLGRYKDVYILEENKIEKNGEIFYEHKVVKRKNQRVDFLAPLLVRDKKTGKLIVSDIYTVLSHKRIGMELEDAVHLILFRLNCIQKKPPEEYLTLIPTLKVPSHNYNFKRNILDDKGIIDFESDSIVIECKNWSSPAGYIYVRDDHVREQILPRFINYTQRKILLIPDVLSPYQKEEIKKGDIEIYNYKTQILPSNTQENLNCLMKIMISILQLDMAVPDVSCIWIEPQKNTKNHKKIIG